MTLEDCLNSHTHREYRTWKAHYQLELSRPSRADHYQMQVALEIATILSKKKYKLDDFKIEWLNQEEAKKRHIERSYRAWETLLHQFKSNNDRETNNTSDR